MIAIRGKFAVPAALTCVLLAGCGPTATASAPATATPANGSVPSSAAASTTAAAPAKADGSVTACELVNQSDASTIIGSAVGAGTAGGTAALSECIYDDGALIVGVKADSTTFYNTSHSAAVGRGAKDVPDIGDSAFVAGAKDDTECTLMFLKGTTLVSIIYGGPGAQAAAVATAKVAAAKL